MSISKIIVVLIGSLIMSASYAASFDCNKAKTYVEKTVCDTPVISKLDDELSEKYRKALKQFGETVKTEQRTWLKDLNSCSDPKCVNTAYLGRISEIDLLLGGNKASESAAKPVLDIKKIKTGEVLRTSCSQYEMKYCTVISKEDIQALCKAAVGLTAMGVGTATLLDPKASELLKNNQAMSAKIGWNEEKKKCIVKITQSGILQGNSIVRYTHGETTNFIVGENQRILVEHVSNTYSE